LHRRTGEFNAAIDDFLLAMDKADHDENNQIYKEAQRQLLLCYNDFAVECFRLVTMATLIKVAHTIYYIYNTACQYMNLFIY